MRFLSILTLAMLLMSCQNNAQENVDLKTRKDSVSYAIGYNIGTNFKMQSIDVDPTVVAAAMRDLMNEGETKMTEEDAQQIWMSYQKELMAKQQEERAASGAKNKEEGDKWLAENKEKEGVVTTESGLQYKVIKMGDGPKPQKTDKVRVNYRGTLIDGTEFDSSYKRGEPAEFGVGQVIPGWTEALQLMPVGSKWEVYIPGELGYGERGAGQDIGPNATLIFEVELLDIVK
ncbi:FKBP-type peptidyl-prolyl cis-trans isomerase [bacterium]|nr:FKBP-type peptidyl-prolyl cis-trans isomerase [bacterium]